MRGIGTRYHFNDTYRTVMERGTLTPRLYPATVDGKVEGEPVYLTREELADKRRDMGPYVFGAQMLQDPTADEKQGFKREWIKYAAVDQARQELVIVCDPSSVIEEEGQRLHGHVGAWIRSRSECLRPRHATRPPIAYRTGGRCSSLGTVSGVRRRWATSEYGLMADIEHFQEMQREEYRFEITEVRWCYGKE
jgi:hypothetical protein